MSQDQNSDRRKFIALALQGIGLTAMGGLIWGGHLNSAKDAPLLLRPPGALKEGDFLKSCIRCGLCVQHCPFDTLRLAKPGENAPVGTPYFIPREIPCYMCEDIPCVPVCPTGSLDAEIVSSIKDGKKELDITKAQMGVAVIDEESCIAFWGIQCDACYRACPLLDQAIKVEFRRNDRTGKHSFLLPVVYSEFCTDCGLCERACVTEKAAIYVLPKDVALGKVGNNYIKGWDSKDELRIKDIEVKKDIKMDEKKATDYLNEGSF